MDKWSTRGSAYFLEELLRAWGVGASELRRWLADGRLRAHVWLPVMSVYRALEVAECSADLCHWEGYAAMSPCCCYRLFRSGQVRLREFVCGRSGERYELPGRADDVVVELGDLVILDAEKSRFEVEGNAKAASLAGRCEESPGDRFESDSSFKLIKYLGNEYRLGDLQAAVLKELWRRAKEGDPWQSGKAVLSRVGSQSYSLSSLFRRNPVWRELVQSDGRGSYRLRTDKVRVVDE